MKDETKYEVIYADPAWRFGNSVYQDNGRDSRHLKDQYETMTIEQMKELPLANILADNCALFLWTTDFQLVEAERTKHSRKPQEVRSRIEKLFGECKRLEMFAREAKQGWDVWGNEVEGSISFMPCYGQTKCVRSEAEHCP